LVWLTSPIFARLQTKVQRPPSDAALNHPLQSASAATNSQPQDTSSNRDQGLPTPPKPDTHKPCVQPCDSGVDVAQPVPAGALAIRFLVSLFCRIMLSRRVTNCLKVGLQGSGCKQHNL
jgi:hypothetical protein